MSRVSARLSKGKYTPTSDADSAGPRVLLPHRHRSNVVIHGVGTLAFGCAFAIVGITLFVLSWRNQVVLLSGTPPWITAVIPLYFAMGGLSTVPHAVAAIKFQRRVRWLRERHGSEPWVWDYPWDQTGSRDDSSGRIILAVWLSVFLALIAVPLNWVGFISPERRILFTIAAVIMNCVVVGYWCWTAYLVRRRMRYGVPVLRFRRFPFRRGEDIELRLTRPRALEGIAAPEATLRCVRERHEVRGNGRNRHVEIISDEMWSVAGKAELERDEYVWRFAVPVGVLGTALSHDPPRYWELALAIATPGVDYGATFLVPIYADKRRR